MTFSIELSSQKHKNWSDRKHTGRYTWILQYFTITVVTNETNLSITVAGSYLESELHYICHVYDWTWDIHVVSWWWWKLAACFMNRHILLAVSDHILYSQPDLYVFLCVISKGFQISLFNYKTMMGHRKHFVQLFNRDGNLLQMGENDSSFKKL